MNLKPFASNDVPWTEWSDAPRFSIRYRHLTLAALGDPYQIGVAIEELPAGMRTAPAHYHIFEEEHVYILEGALTLRLGADRYEMKAGDYVCFPAGQKAGHCLINNSGAPCRYVIVGERNPNEVSVFTDTNKVMVRALGRGTILDLAALRGYWDGENTGLPAGVVPPAAPVEPEPPVVPKPPISSKDVAWNEEGPGRGTTFGGRSKHLTYAAVGGRDYRVGMLIESPAPGQRLCPKHFHMVEEEHAFILEGQVTLLLGDERFDMKPGDYVCFPAGRTIGHSFLNSGTGPCSYLMIGNRSPHDVCVYPDSNKLAVGALNTEASIFDMGALRRYWDGENVG